MPAPYVARYKWVYTDSLSRMSEDEWKERIGTSYQLVAAKLPAKLKKHLGLSA
jgi:predicted DNA-binding protein (MmcQ/YjbR family)